MAIDLMPATRHLTPGTWPEITFDAGDRILILAPHPDDESVACGGVIQRGLAGKLPVHVAYLTNGDNNEWSFMVYRKRLEILPWQVRKMGEVRHDEALAAAQVLGLPPGACTFLGYPDFGTLHIWRSHWGAAPAFRSMLTFAKSVPYHDAYRIGAAYKGEEIVSDLTAVLRQFRPTRIFLSHPADHNPDHAALYLFTQIALWGLAGELRPQLYPFLVHYPRWPHPRGLAKNAALVPPEPLSRRCAWQVLPVSDDELDRKEAALRAHQTQYDYSRHYLDSFVRPNELFGDFEAVSLPDASHSGVSLGADAGAPTADPAEELEDEENARFVGLESHTIRRIDGALELSIGLSRPLAHEVTASVYCFGYRSDLPFANMPKLHIEVGERRVRVRDQNAALREDAVAVRREARTIVIRVPLALSGQPRRVFVSATTRLGDIPLSSLPWRVVELPAGEST